MSDPYDELVRLAALKDGGVLTEEEFAKRKAEILRAISGEKPEPTLQKPTTRDGFVEADVLVSPETKSKETGSLTWNDFLVELETKGTALELQTYRTKFQALVDQNGLGGVPIADKASHSKLSSTTSWNWAGFLFSVYWFAYRGVYGWQLILALNSALILVSAYVPALNTAAVVFCIVGGRYSNAVLLYSLARVRNLKGASGLAELEPSGARVGIALVVTLAAIFVFLQLGHGNQTSFNDAMGAVGVDQNAGATAEALAPSGAGEPAAAQGNAEKPNKYSMTYSIYMSSGDAAQGIATMNCLEAEQRVQTEQLDTVYRSLLAERESEERTAIATA